MASNATTASLSSPTLSSTSSFDMMSSDSSPPYDSDDEIVWSLSSSAISADSARSGSDFVVLGSLSRNAALPASDSPVEVPSDSASDISSSDESLASSDVSSSSSLDSTTSSNVAGSAISSQSPRLPLMASRALNIDEYPTPSATPSPVASKKASKPKVKPVKVKQSPANLAAQAKALALAATAKAKAARERAQVTTGKSQKQIDEEKKAAEKARRKAKSARKRARKAEKAAKGAATPPSVATTSPPVTAKPAKSKAKKASPPTTPVASTVGLGARPLVDDCSEVASERGDTLSSYTEASEFITSFINDPETAQTKSKVHRLALMQSILIELGVSTTSMLPRTITAAKALVKSTVFVNISEYLNTRSQGQDALRSLLLPSRKALIKDIRAKGTTPRQFVKAHGLQALLIHC